MQKINLKIAFITIAAISLFTACKDYEDTVVSGPYAAQDAQGVYFPSINKSVVEVEPTDPTEFTVVIARTDSVEAQNVPLSVLVNDQNVFVVPENISFAAGEKEKTFTVNFPSAAEGITYSLLLTVAGNDYVKPYSVNVTRIKWTALPEPAIFVDGIIGTFWVVDYPIPLYANGEVAELATSTRYRFLNVFSLPQDAGNGIGEPDNDGIFKGYPYNEPGDMIDGDFYIIIEVDNTTGKVKMFPSDMGMAWLTYGMFSMGSIYGNYYNDESSYPLGTINDAGNIITFVKNSLYARMANHGWAKAEDPTIIYLTKEAYLEANMKITDYNDLEYEPITDGVLQLYESASQSDSWSIAVFAKAVDIDSENAESQYKNLYYLADLYAAGYGLAFYYDGTNLTIPKSENSSGVKTGQKTGLKFMGKDVWMSSSSNIISKVEVNGDITIYTFGLKFHFEDGTILGEFAEKFYYSTVAPAYNITDFYGNYKLMGLSQFGGSEPDADMSVTIAAGTAANTLVITGIDFAAEVIATFDDGTATMSIAPQALANYGAYDITLYTTTPEGSVSTTAAMDFTIDFNGNLVMTSTSPADGYLLRSEAAGGWIDGYYDLVFVRSATGVPSTKLATTAKYNKLLINKTANIVKADVKKVNKQRKSNFKIQGKANSKQLKKKSFSNF